MVFHDIAIELLWNFNHASIKYILKWAVLVGLKANRIARMLVFVGQPRLFRWIKRFIPNKSRQKVWKKHDRNILTHGWLPPAVQMWIHTDVVTQQKGSDWHTPRTRSLNVFTVLCVKTFFWISINTKTRCHEDYSIWQETFAMGSIYYLIRWTSSS